MSQRRAHNKIPQDQDDYLMAMARREVRAAEAVSAFLDAFPDFTAPDGDRVKRATFLYRHRLVRVRAEGRAEQGETTAQPASAPGAETAAGTVATLNDADVGAGEATHVESPKLIIPSEADAPKLPQVGDRVRVVAGFVIGSCGVVREVVSDPRPSIAVVFDQDVGLWFSPECLVVVGDDAPAEVPSAGGMDGEVRRAEAERDELRAKLSARDAEVSEARRVVERLRKRVDRLNDYIDRLESDGFRTSIRVEGKPIGPMPKSIEFGPLQPAPDSARITLAEEVVRVVRAELEKLGAAKEPPIAPNLAQRYTEIMNLTASSLRECASANRSVSDALQALAAQQADAVAAKDAEIATLKLHLDDLRRQAGLS